MQAARDSAGGAARVRQAVGAAGAAGAGRALDAVVLLLPQAPVVRALRAARLGRARHVGGRRGRGVGSGLLFGHTAAHVAGGARRRQHDQQQ